MLFAAPSLPNSICSFIRTQVLDHTGGLECHLDCELIMSLL
jgi:hypothetical protein